jgi:hypothetical protein
VEYAADVFVSAHALAKDGKRVSEFPPGWPIIIAGVTSPWFTSVCGLTGHGVASALRICPPDP